MSDDEDEKYGKPLGTYTKEEWRIIMRELRPYWTDEYFDLVWEKFMEMKRSKELN